MPTLSKVAAATLCAFAFALHNVEAVRIPSISSRVLSARSCDCDCDLDSISEAAECVNYDSPTIGDNQNGALISSTKGKNVWNPIGNSSQSIPSLQSLRPNHTPPASRKSREDVPSRPKNNHHPPSQTSHIRGERERR